VDTGCGELFSCCSFVGFISGIPGFGAVVGVDVIGYTGLCSGMLVVVGVLVGVDVLVGVAVTTIISGWTVIMTTTGGGSMGGLHAVISNAIIIVISILYTMF